MAEKFTNRMGFTAIVNGKITEEVIKWAEGEIAKLDKKNAKRKAPNGEIKAENKEIAEAILSALANGSMLSTDLAKSIGQNTQKTNGVAGEMVKLGMLSKTKVKVKGKGELTSYSLVPTEEVADEGEVEGE
jgi:predicted transcriptional regulator